MTKRILAGLAGVAVLSTGLVFAQGAPRRAHGMGGAMGPMMMGPGFGGGRMLGRLAEFLDLTEAQKTQAKQIFDTARTQAQPDMKALRDARQKIADVVRSGAAPAQVETQVQTIVQANTAAVQRLVVLHARSTAEFLNLLTPEQRDKAEKLHRLFGPPRRPQQ